MTDRLSAADTAFLYAQDEGSPMHVGGVVVLDPLTTDGSRPIRYDDIVAHIADRISLVPRYRQKVRMVPGRLARPVWVDDDDFDLTYHVRRSALPRPGSDAQLDDLIGRLISRPLDRTRPLWEMYLVEGLSDATRFLPGAASDALVGASVFNAATPGGTGGDPLEWWAGGLVLLGYAVVLIALGHLFSWRRDVT